jgi:nickel transport system ATP-binding protein
MAGTSLLSVEDLVLTVRSGDGESRLVDGLSFTVRENRILGLIGESGSGKSLTCLAVMGLLPRSISRKHGEILFKGQPLHSMDQAGLRILRGKTVGMILQNPMSCFDSVFTIRHHFKETLASHGMNGPGGMNGRIGDVLAEVGFEHPDEILDLYPFQMSGGMLQRVMVALALIMEVSLLIADEPTTDLDVVSQARILDLLEAMRTRHRMAILLVTHDLSVMARMADEVVLMRQGTVVDSGSVAAVFDNPRHPYTKALMDAHLSLYTPRLAELSQRG